MQYLGGKSRLAKRIVDILPIQDATAIWEPFTGGASVSSEITSRLRTTPVICSDRNQDLMDLWQAVVSGWEPPEIGRNLTSDEYRQIRDLPPSPARTFVGYSCSFGGKLWGGLARSSTHVYYEEGRRLLLKKARALRAYRGLHLAVLDFLSCSTDWLLPGSLIYCDPPYSGTTGYQGTFNHAAFWERCVYLKHMGHRVFVSEFTAPVVAHLVACWPRKTSLVRKSHEEQPESLFEVLP